jgi:hypothetical protein
VHRVADLKMNLTWGQSVDTLQISRIGFDAARPSRGGFRILGPRHVSQRLTASELVAELEHLLGMVYRLSPPLNQRPALFLEQKDELGNRIMTLIRRMAASQKRRQASARSRAMPASP